MNEEKLNILKKFTLLLVDDEEALLDKLHTVLSLFFKEIIVVTFKQSPFFGILL